MHVTASDMFRKNPGFHRLLSIFFLKSVSSTVLNRLISVNSWLLPFSNSLLMYNTWIETQETVTYFSLSILFMHTLKHSAQPPNIFIAWYSGIARIEHN